MGGCLTGSEDLGGIEASDFSDLPIAACRRRGFYMQVLVWTDGSTTIHQHGFSGAFRVVRGRSLHQKWSFDEKDGVNSRLRIGRATLESVNEQVVGHVQQILPGGGLTHAVFHLERPSISLVVRTYGEAWHGPQLLLRPPFFAIDGAALANSRRNLIRYLGTLGDALERQTTSVLCESLSQELLALCAPELAERIGMRQFESHLEMRFGSPFSQMVAATVEFERKFLAVHRLRSDVGALELRKLLCILGYAETPAQVLAESVRLGLVAESEMQRVWELVERLLCYPEDVMRLGGTRLAELLPKMLDRQSNRRACSGSELSSAASERDIRALERIQEFVQHSPVFIALRNSAGTT